MRHSRWLTAIALGGVILTTACSQNPAPAQAAAADSAAMRARADSLAAAARRDSLRADSLARARADSIAQALAASRADSVRSEVEREGGNGGPVLASGLDPVRDSLLGLQVYFETDRADLGPQAVRALEQKLEIFRSYPRLEVKVEGHCDERGPDEYNLALGNRRAVAVRDWLVAQGVAANRLTLVSFGEEQPADPRSSEEGWSRNRRAEFRVTRSAR